ncbi:MAG: winged helix-turn-helix transcriptional regulator [Solirubrobacterales bacterium]|jgi:DNA-binding transcriptional ArsR family regulator|nr:winged helix-turn-helix transcriptional regulator [Solirubrobacterales bacterium]
MPPAKTAATSMETTLAAIVAHPTRARSFLILAERTASPAEIAKEIGKDVGHVGYHVRKLQQLDLIELVDEKPVRGAVEHFYRAIERPVVTEEEFAGQSLEEREVFTRAVMQLHVADIARAMDVHTFDARANRVMVRMPMLVDEEGFQELADLHTEMYDKVLEVQAKSVGRMTGSQEEGIPTVSTSMFFETPERRAAERAAAERTAE